MVACAPGIERMMKRLYDSLRENGCNRFGYEGRIALTPGQAERFGAFPLGDPPETRQVDGH